MKTHSTPKTAYRFFLVLLAACAILAAPLSRPLHAGLWDRINEGLLLSRLIGQGQFIAYQRSVDTNDPLFPLEVMSDGFKMVRVYEDFTDNYLVEWTWRVLLKNRSSRPVEITFEYKLQDEDSLLVASAKEFFRTIAVGETVIIEKTGQLPYATALRVAKSDWYIHLQK